MKEYIKKDALIKATEEMPFTMSMFLNRDQCDGANMARHTFVEFFKALPAVDAVPVVRCKDCKHRPAKPEKYRNGFDLEFPDDVCPCKCADPFYSWYPFDKWFCPCGERKGGTDDGRT